MAFIKKLSIKIKMIASFFLVSSIISILLSFILYKNFEQNAFTELQKRLKDITYLGSLSLPVESINKFILALSDIPSEKNIAYIESIENTKEYVEFIQQLDKIKSSNKLISYVYVFYPTQEEYKNYYLGAADFLEDIKKEPREKLSYFNKVLDSKNFPIMNQAIKEKAILVEEELVYDPEMNLYSFSGYAPIFDKSGRFVAMLGVDISAADLQKALSDIYFLSVRSIVISIIFSLIFSIILGHIFTKPILSLACVVKQFATKDFNIRAKIKSRDEIGILANNFNNMADEIQRYSVHLEDMVSQRTRELEMANKQLSLHNEKMKRELKMAQKIQQAIIPTVYPVENSLLFGGIYIPMEELGGDYYDVIKISERKVAILVVDVSGHGVSSALITTMAKVSFNNHSMDNLSTHEIVDKVNQELYKIMENSEKYLTAFYGIIDLVEGTLEYTNAGHPECFILKKESKQIISLPSNGSFIGIFPDAQYRSKKEKVEVGDKVIIYTDGITEAKRGKEFFGEERLRAIIEKNADLTAQNMVNQIMKELKEFMQDRSFNDDCTLLVVDIVLDIEDIEQKGVEIGFKSPTLDEKFEVLNQKYQEATQKFKEGDFKKTVEILLEIQEQFKRRDDKYKIYKLLGNAYYKLKEYEKTMNYWNKALEINPEDSVLLKNRDVLKKMIGA